MTKHDELAGEIATLLHGFWARTLEDRTTTGLIDLENEYAKDVIALILSAVRDGKVKVKCPGCDEAIELLKCTGCHLENLEGYIV